MRKHLFITVSLALASLANAQFRPNYDKEWHRTESDEKKFSFGYFLGANVMTYKVNPKPYNKKSPTPISPNEGVNEYGLLYLDQENTPGLSVGLTAKLRINDYIALKSEPGLHFSQRTLRFSQLSEDPSLSPDQILREVKSTYIEVPLLLNFHGERWVNTRPYIQGGLGYAYNLQSNEKKEDDNGAGVFRTTTHNFNLQAELGIELYFKHFKLTPALKGMFFINNELVADKATTPAYYAGSINSLSTRAVVFSLKFE